MEGVSSEEANRAIKQAWEAKLNPEGSRFAGGEFSAEFLKEMQERRALEAEFGVDFTGEYTASRGEQTTGLPPSYPTKEALDEQSGGPQHHPKIITPLTQASSGKTPPASPTSPPKEKSQEWGDTEPDTDPQVSSQAESSENESEEEGALKERLLNEMRMKREARERVRAKQVVAPTPPAVEDTTLTKDLLKIPSVDWDELGRRMCSVGITLGLNEHNALKRKMESLKELSLRDVIMFLEGYRACSHINEAKLSTQIDDLGKTTEFYRAQARNMERILSEMKGQEKVYFDLLERLSEETREKIEAEKLERKAHLATVMTEKETRVSKEKRRKEREERARRAAEEIMQQDLQQELAHKIAQMSSIEVPEKTEKLMKDAMPRQYNVKASSDTSSTAEDTGEPCTQLLIICLHFNISPDDLVREYGRTLGQLNHACRGMPKTMDAMIKTYLNMTEALNHFHRTVIRDKNT
uniref:Protein 2 n=1 Tax=Sciadopitys virus 1_Chi TaxID=2977987 RepID=A0A9N6YJE5_9RHAB|nr:TPA_asm: protein 2 [Sciadopitys virus 1_Chi]